MSFRKRLLPFMLPLSLLALTPACSSCGPDDPDTTDMDAVDMDIDREDQADSDDMASDMTVDPDEGDPDPDMDPDMTVDPDMGPDSEIVTCPTPIAPAPAGQLCAVTAGSGGESVVLRGTVLAADGTIYRNGAVVYDSGEQNGEILYVGCEPESAPQAASATLIECAEGVISPGLFNAHDHLGFNTTGEPKPHGEERFDHRHDWRKGKRGHMSVKSNGSNNKAEAVQYSELRHLLSGATSIAGSAGAPGLLRNLDQAANNGGLSGLTVDYSTFPLGDSDGDLIDSGCNYPRIDSENVLNNTIYLPHVAEGIDAEANNEFKCLNGGSGRDLIAANTSIIHGIGLTAADIADMSASGAKLVWSPRTNIDLYGQTADIPTYKRLGVTIALGTDWIISGSMNMQRELACVNELNSVYLNQTLSEREIFEMATINGAMALGAQDRLGSIEAGKIADLVIFDGSESGLNYRAIMSGQIDRVALVTRGGEALYGAEALIDALATDASKCEALDVCGASQKACVELDTGSTIASLTSESGSPPYPLFFCEIPEDEPSCTPLRPEEYTGAVSDEDGDGDGLTDGEDNCPRLFNPRRPLGDNAQPNFDDDTFGDSCDICPVSGPEMVCEMFDPNDRDSDGVPNAADNCPATPNMDQSDLDNDEQGDVCDSCPMDANPNGGACPASIYDINQGGADQGALVRVSEAVVSGAGTDGYFVQVPVDSDAYQGADYSGVFVYAPDEAALPERGDRVELEGTVAEFRGGTQLTGVTILSSADGVAPSPISVEAEELLRTGSKGEAYEGLLVSVNDVEVADISSYDDFGEVRLVSGLYLGDTLYAYEKPEVGDRFTTVIGHVVYRNFSASDGNRIAPRGEDDLITGPPSLAGFTDDEVYLEYDSTRESPTPELRVELTSDALTDLVVDLSFSGAVFSPMNQITIPAGERVSDPILLDSGPSRALGQMGTVTASYDGVTASATVQVFVPDTPRSPVAIDPTAASLIPGGSLTMTVTLDVPGSRWIPTELSVTTTGDVTAPATIVLPAGAQQVDFVVTADAAGMGPATITVSTPSGMITATLDVNALPSQCLIISEVVEGGGFNKAVELYNCGGSTLDLSGITLCQANGANTNCSATLALSSMLAAGEVYVVCNSQLTDKSSCDVESGVTSFNGDDRLIVFEDLGGMSDKYDVGTDTLYDAFGQYGTQPSTSIWADKTYDRCDFMPYDGVGPFDVLDYFNEEPKDTLTGLGVAPTMGCVN